MTTWGSVSQPRRPSLLVTAIFALIGSITFPLSTHAASSQITQLSATGPAQVNQGELTTDITIETRNADGTPEILLPAGATLALSSTSPTGTFYTNGDTTTSVQNVTMAPGTSSTTVRYLDTAPGEYTLKFNLSGSNLSETLMTEQQITVIDTSPVDTSQILFTSSPDVYRALTSTVRLTADEQATEVLFGVDGNNESISGQLISRTATTSVWQPDPTVTPEGGTNLTGKVLIKNEWHTIKNQVKLHDSPTLSLQSYTEEQKDEILNIRGAVTDTHDSDISVQLLSVDDPSFTRGQLILVRGTDIDLAQILLNGVPNGAYNLHLIAVYDGEELARSTVSLQINKDQVPSEEIPGEGEVPGEDDIPDNTPDNPLGDDDPSIGNPVVDEEIFIPRIEIDPIDPLSTAFSLPLSRLVTSGQKTADAFGTVSKASVPADDGEVLSAEERNLQEAIDLKMDEPTQVPLAPTSGGWSVFGIAWYWWGTGLAAAWVSGVGLRWWLRKS